LRRGSQGVGGEGHDLQDVVEGEGGKYIGVDDHFLGGEGELVHVQRVGQARGAGSAGSAGGEGVGRGRRRGGLIIRRRRRGRGVHGWWCF